MVTLLSKFYRDIQVNKLTETTFEEVKVFRDNNGKKKKKLVTRTRTSLNILKENSVDWDQDLVQL